jgi:hypothetical protein
MRAISVKKTEVSRRYGCAALPDSRHGGKEVMMHAVSYRMESNKELDEEPRESCRGREWNALWGELRAFPKV